MGELLSVPCLDGNGSSCGIYSYMHHNKPRTKFVL